MRCLKRIIITYTLGVVVTIAVFLTPLSLVGLNFDNLSNSFVKLGYASKVSIREGFEIGIAESSQNAKKLGKKWNLEIAENAAFSAKQK